MQESKSPNKGLIALVAIVLLVAVAGTTIVMGSNKKSGDDESSASTVAVSTAPSTSVAPNATFKDGTYSATANYDTPGGQQSITVKMTVAGGTISDSSLQQVASAREDEVYESQFESGYKSEVVGKKLADINLSRVSGASLTTEGFNSALAEIQKQAQT